MSLPCRVGCSMVGSTLADDVAPGAFEEMFCASEDLVSSIWDAGAVSERRESRDSIYAVLI